MTIDKKTYAIKPINHFSNVTPKTQILLALSLRKDHRHIIRLQHKEFGKTKRWNTFTVSRDGIIYQHYDPKYHSNFVDIKKADKQSISIVLENMGALFKVGDNNFVNWINEECPIENIEEKKHSIIQYWEKFPEKQIKSTIELCKSLSKNFGIPTHLIEFNHYHKDIHKFKGIVFKSNYIQDSTEMNPLFNIEEFNEMLKIKSVKQ